MRRRDFFLAGTGISASWLLAACGSSGPEKAEKLLRYAQRKNQGVERALFRHTSMDVPARHWRNAGRALPAYFVAHHVPVWDTAARGVWTLQVTGLVRTPLTLTLGMLQRLPRTTQRVDHYCVEGWTAIENWTGVRFRDLARAAGVVPEAKYVDFQSFDDGYHESWDLESAMHPQTVVAYGLDGQPLGPAHGAPARVFSPVKLGYKNTKYLTKIVFLPEANGGYWTDRGYEWYGGT